MDEEESSYKIYLTAFPNKAILSTLWILTATMYKDQPCTWHCLPCSENMEPPDHQFRTNQWATLHFKTQGQIQELIKYKCIRPYKLKWRQYQVPLCIKCSAIKVILRNMNTKVCRAWKLFEVELAWSYEQKRPEANWLKLRLKKARTSSTSRDKQATWKSLDGGVIKNQIDHCSVDSRHFSDRIDVKVRRRANVDSDQ